MRNSYADPNVFANQQLDRTHTKVSINTFIRYTRFFGYGLIATVIASLGNFETDSSSRKEFPMARLAPAKESHINSIEEVIHAAKPYSTGAKGGPIPKLGRSITIGCVLLGLLVLAPNSWAQTRPPIFEKVAKTYGLDSWDKIEAIRYTWNLQFGTFNVSRSWEWDPKTTKVTYVGKDKYGKPVKLTSKPPAPPTLPHSMQTLIPP